MKIELHINGRVNVDLTPETEIEKVVVSEMQEAASKGKAVKIESVGGAMRVSVEK